MDRYLRISGWSLLVMLLAAPGIVLAQAPNTVLERIQAKYESVDALRVRFTQKTESEFSKRSTRASRTAALLAGRRGYRIETLSQTLVTDGTTAWIYTPSENQVVINDFVDDGRSAHAGRIFYDCPERYNVAAMETVEQDGETIYVLDLTPKSADSAYRGGPDPRPAPEDDAMIARLRLADQNGSTTSVFDLAEIAVQPLAERRSVRV
ncbi:MAG: outer membrane lipoprotein carrier protein LolA [Gammaproteobacteria bacterium]|nr:outer membrane lipoprotein carrier protein LolA [Gammaproteobacteria bacterium]